MHERYNMRAVAAAAATVVVSRFLHATTNAATVREHDKSVT